MNNATGSNIRYTFIGKGKEKPRSGYKTQKRNSVLVMIKHPKNNSYLCEIAKGRNLKSFVLGGIEPGETPTEAAVRETIEETGYNDITIDSVSEFIAINHFFASYKNVNRFASVRFVIGHLNSLKQKKISTDEKSKHTVVWKDINSLEGFLNNDMNLVALSYLLEEKL